MRTPKGCKDGSQVPGVERGARHAWFAKSARLRTLKAFYERGCQEKHLTASRLPEVKTARGSQP